MCSSSEDVTKFFSYSPRPHCCALGPTMELGEKASWAFPLLIWNGTEISSSEHESLNGDRNVCGNQERSINTDSQRAVSEQDSRNPDTYSTASCHLAYFLFLNNNKKKGIEMIRCPCKIGRKIEKATIPFHHFKYILKLSKYIMSPKLSSQLLLNS